MSPELAAVRSLRLVPSSLQSGGPSITDTHSAFSDFSPVLTLIEAW